MHAKTCFYSSIYTETYILYYLSRTLPFADQILEKIAALNIITKLNVIFPFLYIVTFITFKIIILLQSTSLSPILTSTDSNQFIQDLIIFNLLSSYRKTKKHLYLYL